MKEKIIDILERHYYGRNQIESRCADELLNLFDVMQRSELFKKRCSVCGIDEIFTKDDYCNCCGAKQVSFF